MVFIILTLFVEFSYLIEHLIQKLRFRCYSKVTFRTRIALEDGLFGRFVVKQSYTWLHGR